MTIPLLITGTFDGATNFDLSNPDSIDPGSGIRNYTPPAAVGRLLLPTIDNPDIGITTQWSWLLSMVMDDPTDIGTLDMELQNGDVLPVIPNTTLQNEQWNLLLPQGAILVAGATPVGGTGSGVLYFTLTRVAADDWFDLQCCHLYAPLPAGLPA